MVNFMTSVERLDEFVAAEPEPNHGCQSQLEVLLYQLYILYSSVNGMHYVPYVLCSMYSMHNCTIVFLILELLSCITNLLHVICCTLWFECS